MRLLGTQQSRDGHSGEDGSPESVGSAENNERISLKLWIQYNWRARQIRYPRFRICKRDVKHQMRNLMPGGVVKVSLFRHHVAHCARFQGGQLFHIECLDVIDNLRFGESG